MLRDRLVCGLRDMKLQRRLLAEPSLTFKKAFELTQAAEVAERSTKELQAGKGVPNQSPDTDVLAVGPWRQQQQQAEKCYRCGGNHRATGCRFRTADCHNCGKKGHLARVCRSKTKTPLKTQHHLDEELQCFSVSWRARWHSVYAVQSPRRAQAQTILGDGQDQWSGVAHGGGHRRGHFDSECVDLQPSLDWTELAIAGYSDLSTHVHRRKNQCFKDLPLFA